MRKLLTALVLLVGVSSLAPTSPAHAADTEPLARVVYPLAATHAKGTVVKLQIEGSADDWGLRQFAKAMDARWPGLRVRVYGTCADRPTWACVTVTTGAWDPDQQLVISRGHTHFLGLMDYTGYNRRAVYLNSFYLTPEYDVNPYAVVAHEFGHVLGLNHHQQGGVTSTPGATVLSWAEDKALRPYYGKGLGR